MMSGPKLEVPAELRELAEKTIDQAERAFGLFFDAARRSTATAPTPVVEPRCKSATSNAPTKRRREHHVTRDRSEPLRSAVKTAILRPRRANSER